MMWSSFEREEQRARPAAATTASPPTIPEPLHPPVRNNNNLPGHRLSFPSLPLISLSPSDVTLLPNRPTVDGLDYRRRLVPLALMSWGRRRTRIVGPRDIDSLYSSSYDNVHS